MAGALWQRNRGLLIGTVATLTLIGPGCSDSSTQPVNESEVQASPARTFSDTDELAANTAPPMPTASIGQSPAPMDFAEPEQGSPVWLLREASRLRAELAPPDAEENSGETSLSPEARRARLNQIVDLAHEAIAATHKTPEQEVLFNNAVRFLTDARVELALAGDEQAGELLVEDADLLYRRDPQSFAASEANFKVVRLAQLQAEQHDGADHRWMTEYANQARSFAEKFPKETSRAAVTLLEAGRACDRQGLVAAARGCYETISTRFAGTPFAEQVAGCLRRLNLVGQPLDLGGPTIDGGFSNIDQYKGRVVLVVFWSAESPTFQTEVPQLLKMEQTLSPQGLSMIGVNVDADESAVDAFISQHELAWPQIFSADVSQRGAASPLVRYYGIQAIPTYWLVDQQGIVRHALAEVGRIEASVIELLNGT